MADTPPSKPVEVDTSFERELFDSCVETMEAARREYSHEGRYFDNFERNAKALGLTPEQVWAVYAGKHWDALMTFIRTGGATAVREPIVGRVKDLISYLALFARYQEGQAARREEMEREVKNFREENRDPGASKGGVRERPLEFVGGGAFEDGLGLTISVYYGYSGRSNDPEIILTFDEDKAPRGALQWELQSSFLVPYKPARVMVREIATLLNAFSFASNVRASLLWEQDPKKPLDNVGGADPHVARGYPCFGRFFFRGCGIVRYDTDDKDNLSEIELWGFPGGVKRGFPPYDPASRPNFLEWLMENKPFLA